MPARILFAALLAVAPALHAADTEGPEPAAPSVQERLASARQAVRAGHWKVAEQQLAAALRQAPDNADVHNLLGYTYRKRARPDVARSLEHYRTALRLDPRHRGAHEYIGQAYLQDNRLAEAERHLAELERICGSRACEEYRDLERAIADFKARR